MKTSDWFFALLRKSRVLKNVILTDNDRQMLIHFKYEYSKLQPTLRKMIYVMADELSIDRFETENSSKQDLCNVLENYHQNVKIPLNKCPVLIDTVSGNRFVITHDTIKVGDVVVFKENEHNAFVVAYGCLLRAKERQAKLIAERDEEERRMNVLSEFK